MVGALSSKEEHVVREFANRVRERFADEVRGVRLFGSKARGDHHAESDIDILITTRSDDWRLHDEIRRVGYELDEHIDYRLSIHVITEDRFERARERNFQFASTVFDEGVRV